MALIQISKIVFFNNRFAYLLDDLTVVIDQSIVTKKFPAIILLDLGN